MDSTQYILDIIKLHQKGQEAIIVPPINKYLNIQNNSKIQNDGNKAKKMYKTK